MALFSFLFSLAHSQVISRFTWDSNPLTTAIVGPNAISAGSSATCSAGGVGGTFGLNPGLPKTDINLTIPNTGGVFDVPNIDISIDYRRNESTASLIKRGNFTFNSGNNPGTFLVVYRVDNGTTAGQTVTGTGYAVPNDNTYRNFRFTYDNCAGIGKMYVDNSVVWTSTATPGKNLYWNGDGNMVIGQDMDGNGNNIVNLDNFVMKNFPCSTLPIELISFTAENEGQKNILKWITATELNTDYFIVQRSEDGIHWTDLNKTKAAGNSMNKKYYISYDSDPPEQINYYRLTQTDISGATEKFSIVAVDNVHIKEMKVIRTVDVLGREVNEHYDGIRFTYYSNGLVIKSTGL